MPVSHLLTQGDHTRVTPSRRPLSPVRCCQAPQEYVNQQPVPSLLPSLLWGIDPGTATYTEDTARPHAPHPGAGSGRIPGFQELSGLSL